MLTDLSFLNPGQPWPPESERERLKTYEQNRALFRGEQAEVYKEQLKRIERVIGNFEQVISYSVILNFHKLMSLKIADLLLGEPPIISAGNDANSKQQKTINEIKKNSDLINTAYMAAIDISCWGDGIFQIRDNPTTGGGRIGLSRAPLWFPVVQEDDIQEIQYHVLAWTTGPTDAQKLKVQIHGARTLEVREYTLDKNIIGKRIDKNTSGATRLTENAIIQVSNVRTSDSATGLDDYGDIDSIISDIIVRIGQIDKILDKHAAPSMTGPQSALEQDPETHMWHLKTGNYFPRETTEDPEVKYIVWNAALAANFTQIEKLVNLLYTLSEMGSALFGDMSANPGQVPSGSALRRLMIQPLAKVNRIRMRMDPALKQAIALCSQLGGKDIVTLKPEDITITWQDGLPGDPTEEATIIGQRTAGKATMSQYRALQMYDGMSKEAAEEEIARISDEEDTGGLPPFSQGIESQPPGTNEPEPAATPEPNTKK